MEPIILKEKTEEELLDLFNFFQQSLETEARYHAILDNMKEGFQLIDFGWKYIYVNDTVVKQSKFTREELIGSTMPECYPGIENTEMFKVLKECMLTRSSKKFTNEFVYPDQTKAWFELSIQPTQEGLFILSMDITDLKQTELDKEKHIEEIQELLFKISHEVRHPVCHLLGISHLFDRSLVHPEEVKSIIEYIKKSIALLDTYTRELTAFVSEMKMNAVKPENESSTDRKLKSQ